jgi:membrane protein implicated in regulation of membrane protease activity
MCHLVLLLPVLALPVFWLVPLSIAAPSYALVVVVSGWIYWLAIRAMRRPLKSGAETLIHTTGEVIGKADGMFQVRVGNEIWYAVCGEELQPGDHIEVTGFEAMRLKVCRVDGTGSDAVVP